MNRRAFLGGSAAVMASPVLLATVGCPEQNWLDNAESDAQTANIILVSVVAVVGVAEANNQISASIAAKIRQAVQIAQTTLNELVTLIQSYKAAPADTILGKISTTLTELALQLPGILDGILIADTQARTAITAGISLLISIVAALQIIVPAIQSASTGPQARTRATKPTIQSGDVVLPTRDAIVSMYNSVLVQNGYAGQQIQ
ncbi:MAG TPA: hypothetical protein VK638_28600 [Edaphobacter sp.]|nr:hypothetical protein [Edaphobacter sp.]